MDAKLGRLTATLAEPQDCGGAANPIELINRNINPPLPVTAASVHIRAMYIVSDEINSFGGKFTTDEYATLCRLLVDSPVMVGHRKDRLPIARNFHAAVVERAGRRWVKCWFYWLRDTDGAETLRRNIDGGIYRECSISFTFLFAQCSVCGQDIRVCQHQPGQSYRTEESETDIVCHYCYRRIERVLETSLVYRGAIPDTRLAGQSAEADGEENERLIQSPTELPVAGQYLVAPCYDGLAVLASCDDRVLSLVRQDGGILSAELAVRDGMNGIPNFEAVPGYLIGLRGKERCSADQVKRTVEGKPSRVTRLQLRLIQNGNVAPFGSVESDYRFSVGMMRHRLCTLPQVNQASLEVATRDGVRIWPENAIGLTGAGCRYLPDRRETAGTTSYTLSPSDEQGTVRLTFVAQDRVHRFAIHQFHLLRLMHGGKFLADHIDSPEGTEPDATPGDRGERTSGRILHMSVAHAGFALQCDGKLAGTAVLRPVNFDGERRFLFYRRPSGQTHLK